MTVHNDNWWLEQMHNKVKCWLENPKLETAEDVVWTARAEAWAVARTARAEAWAAEYTAEDAAEALNTSVAWTDKELARADAAWIEAATVEILNRMCREALSSRST